MFELVHETKYHPLEILLMVSICNLEIQESTSKLKSLILIKKFKGKCLLPLMVHQRALPFFSRNHTGCWTFLRSAANNSAPCITAIVNTSWALLSSFLRNIYIPVTSHGALDTTDYTSSSQLPFKTQISAIFPNVQTPGFCLTTLDTACSIWASQTLLWTWT